VKWRAVPSLLRVGFAAAVAYRGEFLVWILSTNMPLVMLLLWSAVADEAPVGRFGETEFVAYFLATLVVRLLTGAWVGWELNYEIRQGTLAMRLLKPIHPFVTYATDNLAALPLRALIALPIALGALLWVGSGQLASDPLNWLVAPVAVFLAWVITFAAMALIGTLGFFWESSLSVFSLWMGLYFLFAGYTIPLELLPPWLWEIARWLPFRFLLSFPVEVILGLAEGSAVWLGLGMQLVWTVVFCVAAQLFWRAGLRRYAAYGG
jgi:ABC-2 type transport system permease protein